MNKDVLTFAVVVLAWTGWSLYQLRALQSRQGRREDLIQNGWVTKPGEVAEYEVVFRESRKRILQGMFVLPALLTIGPILDWLLE